MIENQYRPADNLTAITGKYEASKAAKLKVAEILARYRLDNLSLINIAEIIEFSSGWRIAYDAYLSAYRVRQTVVMIFVDKSGEVIEEWNDLGEIIDTLKAISPEAEKLASLPKSIAKAQEEYPNATVETVEPVLDPKAQRTYNGSAIKTPVLCWRLGLRIGVERHVVTVADTPDGPTCRTTDQRAKSVAPVAPRMTTRWRIGNDAVRLRSNGTKTHLVVDFEKFGAPLKGGQSDHWTVWSCIARCAQFLNELGYGNIGLYNTIVEFADKSDEENAHERPITSEKGALPVISFPNAGVWSEDITIITHELGHAFWHLMFTRPPLGSTEARYLQALAPVADQAAASQYFTTVQTGIQEGFADYFAAAVLADNAPEVRVGVYVAKLAGTPNPFNLPRPINGKPYIPAPDADHTLEAHDIGRQWANFLWDVRAQLTHQLTLKIVNQIIFESHLRPQVVENSPAEPLACYFHSLQRTAGGSGNSLNWHQLAQSHGIPVEPLPLDRGMAPYRPFTS